MAAAEAWAALATPGLGQLEGVGWIEIHFPKRYYSEKPPSWFMYVAAVVIDDDRGKRGCEKNLPRWFRHGSPGGTLRTGRATLKHLRNLSLGGKHLDNGRIRGVRDGLHVSFRIECGCRNAVFLAWIIRCGRCNRNADHSAGAIGVLGLSMEFLIERTWTFPREGRVVTPMNETLARAFANLPRARLELSHMCLEAPPRV